MTAFSFFTNSFCTLPSQADIPFDHFAEFLYDFYADQRPASEDHKKNCTPLVSPSVYEADSRRSNANVLRWGGWFGLDMDDGQMTVDEACQVMTALHSDYVIYTTTKSTEFHQRYRIFAPLDRDVLAPDIARFWHGLSVLFSGMIDPLCKDMSRMYYVPATWTATAAYPSPYNRFETALDGQFVIVDDIIDRVPAEVSIEVPVFSTPVTQISGTWQPSGWLMRDAILKSCLTPRIIEQYRSTPKGGHHLALFKLMVSCAFEAKRRSYPITSAELVSLAREIDSTNVIKTNPNRWSRMDYEAQRALEIVAKTT